VRLSSRIVDIILRIPALENSSSNGKNTSTLYERNACKASTFVNKSVYIHIL
jgi:hypothetical protein